MLEFAKRSATVLIITGALAVIFGIVALVYPIGTAITLLLIWGWYALIDGVLELIAAFRPENRRSKGFLIFTGALGVIAGLMVIFRPIESATAVAWILGIWLIIRGVSSLISAFAPLPTSTRIMVGVSGVLFIIAGIIFFNNPGSAALAVSSILGVLLLIWGGFTLGGGVWILQAKRDAEKLVEQP